MLCRPCLCACLFCIAGILLYRTENGRLRIPILLLLLIAGLIQISRNRVRQRKVFYITVWLLSFCFAPLGMLRAEEACRVSELKGFLDKGEEATVSGTIDFISDGEESYKLTLSSATAQIGQNTLNSKKILVYVDYATGFEPCCGMKISVKGRMYPCEKATNPGQFDSDIYYAVRKVDARLYSNECPSVLSFEENAMSILYKISSVMIERIGELYPKSQAGIMISMLTGDRELLDKEMKSLYSEGGIAHILAISSLHITLLGMGLFRVLMKISGRLRANVIISLVVMWSYVLLTGYSASSVRAVIMLSVMLMGRVLGRGHDKLNTLAFSGLILLLIQPLYIFDSGFKLSYAAVLGIIAADKVITIYGIKNKGAVSLIVSFSIQLFTFPILLQTYYYFNPYTILANLIVLPLVSVILVCGAVSTFLSVFNFMKMPAVFAAGAPYYVLRFYEKLCETEMRLPYSKVLTGCPQKKYIIIYYAVVIITFLTVCGKRTGERKRLLYFGLLLICGIIFIKPSPGEITTSFIDVGQGDGILFELSDGSGIKRVLFDSGSTSVKNVGTYRVIPFLKYKGIEYLDNVVISHTDTDHISAIAEMIEEGYPAIGELTVGCCEDMSEQIISMAAECGIPIHVVQAGDKLGEYITFISPEKDHQYADKNSASVVTYIEYNDFSMLLTGDSDFESEKLYGNRLKSLMKNDSVSVLKLAHHGSKNSSSLETMLLVNPVCTVISCAKYNRYKHPSTITLERLAKVDTAVFMTRDSGMVTVTYDHGRMGILIY